MVNENNNNDEVSGTLAVINSFEKKLSTAVEHGEKKIPQFQKRDIIAMKEEHLGNLKSQIMYLKSNKKSEFKDLYSEDIELIKSQLNGKYNKKVEQIDKMREKFRNELGEHFLTKFKSEFGDLFRNIDSLEKNIDVNCGDGVKLLLGLKNNVSKDELETEIEDLKKSTASAFSLPVRISNNIPNFEKVVGLLFELEYGGFYRSATEQIDKLEKLFKESLNFNDLQTAHGVYQELKKADSILDKVSKHETPKIEIDFSIYLDYDEIEKLEDEIEKQKKYDFSTSN